MFRMEYTFLVINIIMILLVLAMHPYFIVTQLDYVTGNWTYLLLLIEFPVLIYLIFNVIVIISFRMEEYVKRMLKYRYVAIDLLFIPILAGLIACIVKFVEYDNAMKKGSLLTSAEIAEALE